MQVQLVNKNSSNESEEWLSNFYQNGFIPEEKKNYLSELDNSCGAYLAVKNNQSYHYLLDLGSQIATLGFGFSPSSFFGVTHLIESYTNDFRGQNFPLIKQSLNRFFKAQLGWSHCHTYFYNSGAETNEVALGLCYQKRIHPKSNKILAFEGSFHGRMQVSLTHTWNKSKREPFEWPGYQADFLQAPTMKDDKLNKKIPHGWQLFWENSVNHIKSTPFDHVNDPLLLEEIKVLKHVQKRLMSDEYFAIILEPMQCEGGDRYTSNRFHLAMLTLAKLFKVPLIYDEVQTGFHLGRKFFWHRQFDLKDSQGKILTPDFVVCSKKSQAGMLLSPRPFHSPQQTNFSSVYRGYIQAILLDQYQAKIVKTEDIVREKLCSLVKKFENFLENPRANGLSFSFDVKNENDVAGLVNLRFHYGLLFYPAGTGTIRFRVHLGFRHKDLDLAFQCLDRLLEHYYLQKDTSDSNTFIKINLKAHRKIKQFHLLCAQLKLDQIQSRKIKNELYWKSFLNIFSDNLKEYTFDIINHTNFKNYKQKIQSLEQVAYEPSRQTDINLFEKVAMHKKGVALALCQNDKLLGIAFAGPLHLFPYERGIRNDPFFDPHNDSILYMLDVTVHPAFQGQSLGKILKYALTFKSILEGNERIQGRNRDRYAKGMYNINFSLGICELQYIKEDYPDDLDFRDVTYYTTPITWHAPPLKLDGINSYLRPRDLNGEYLNQQQNLLVNKMCLSNFVSKQYLQQLETFFLLMPKSLQFGYTCSGQSEAVDKIVKSIWYHQNQPTKEMLTFQGHFFGHGSFLSRSLSYPNEHYFKVDRFPHPGPDNYLSIIKNLRNQLEQQKYMSIWIEPIRQLYGDKVPQQFLEMLIDLGYEFKIPVVFNETASQFFRYNIQHFYTANSLSKAPMACMSYLSGQQSIVFVKKEYFIDKPLMLISTWDGDEASLCHAHHQLQLILENKKVFNTTIKNFDKKIKELLGQYKNLEYFVENSIGHVEGNLPIKLRKMFRASPSPLKHVIIPSYSQVNEFLEWGQS